MHKNNDYIAHACLNSKLSKNDKDFCERGFIAEAPSKETCAEQCWKYCAECEAKGFPVITKKPINEKLKAKMTKARAAKNKNKSYKTVGIPNENLSTGIKPPKQ